eukprot:6735811-Alexandrium_andersonii.AAC.1
MEYAGLFKGLMGRNQNPMEPNMGSKQRHNGQRRLNKEATRADLRFKEGSGTQRTGAHSIHIQ